MNSPLKGSAAIGAVTAPVAQVAIVPPAAPPRPTAELPPLSFGLQIDALLVPGPDQKLEALVSAGEVTLIIEAKSPGSATHAERLRSVAATLSSDEAGIGIDQASFALFEGTPHGPVTLKIGAGLEGKRATIALSVVGENGAASIAVELRLRIVAQQLTPTPEFKKASFVDLDSRPPNARKVAILHVLEGEKKLRVFGFHPTGELTNAEIARPAQHPMDLVDAEGKPDFEAAAKHIARLSNSGMPEVQAWLEKVRQEPDVALIVSEASDSCIPWEMLKLRKGKRLGAEMIVVRWTRVIRTINQAKLKLERCAHAGGLYAFKDATFNENVAEAEALEAWSEHHHEGIADFVDRLNQMPDDIGLIFVAAHGEAKPTDGVGRLSLGDDVTSALDLELVNGRDEPLPFAFLNACYSARLADEVNRGLPEVFLGQIAGSFLGCLGPVHQAVADDVGARVLRAARAQGGVNVPALLLELRREAAADEKNSVTWIRRFINTFMYVFYGSPETWLMVPESAAPAGQVSDGQ